MAVKATVQLKIRASGETKESLSVQPYSKEQFLRLLYVEQRRVERSGKRFVLMLAEPSHPISSSERTEYFQRLTAILGSAIRETDIVGWFDDGNVIGVIFTEIETEMAHSVTQMLQSRFAHHLSALNAFHPTKTSWYVYPNDWEHSRGNNQGSVLQQVDPAIESDHPDKRIKRLIDIAGSTLALTLGAPLFLIIALIVKLTSRGPVFFKQTRVGKYGQEFTFWKFRSMTTNNDTAIHERFVDKLISGKPEPGNPAANGKAVVYKLAKDPRVTTVGRILRKTSLDELPQFYNVLIGDMSLVGPRPPIPYEVNRYQLWHKRRFLTVKPGMTGLWQVTGRSRTTFDEMVRLDLQYSQSWTIWTDLNILLQTPLAVIRGAGAV